MHATEKMMSFSKQFSRRDLGKVAIGSAFGAAVNLSLASFAEAAIVPPQASGIHLSCNAPMHPKNEDILFFKQLGLDTVYARGTTPEDQTVEGLKGIKKRYADVGINITDVDNPGVNNNLGKIVLNMPGRDKAIEAYKQWIRTLGQGGFQYMEAMMFNATASVTNGEAKTRGGTAGREYDDTSEELSGSPWRVPSRGAKEDLLFGRRYTKDEIWENYTHFVREIAPVAEEAGVKVTLDNDDPPVPEIFGIPRIMSSFEDVKKALKIANSPNIGLCFTAGQWIEGGKGVGTDPVAAAEYFGREGKIFQVFMRNPSSTLPKFHETYIDDGVFDLYKVVKALVDAKYNGVMTLDHWMQMVGGRRTYEAFGLGYLRALLQRAQIEAHA